MQAIQDASEIVGDASHLCLRLRSDYADLLRSQSRFREAAQQYTALLNARAKFTDSFSSNNIEIAQDLASVYLDTHEFSKSMRILRTYLLRGSLPGEAVSIDSIVSLHIGAKALLGLRDYPEADRWISRAAWIFERNHSKDDSGIFAALDEFIRIKALRNRSDEADTFVANLAATVAREQNPANSNLSSWLATYYFNRKAFDQAIQFISKAIEIRECAPHTAISDILPLLTLANEITNEGQFYGLSPALSQLGEQYARRRVAIAASTFGVASEQYAGALLALSRSLAKTSPRDAERYAAAAIDAERALGGDSGPYLSTYYFTAAMISDWMDECQNCEAWYKQAIAVDERRFGVNDPEVATDLRAIADYYSKVGQSRLSVEAAQRAVSILERSSEADQDLLALSLFTLGEALSDSDRFAEAAVCLERARSMYTRTRGPKCADVANVCVWLGHTYFQMRKYRDAENLLLQATAIYRLNGMEHHEMSYSSWRHLARCYLAENRLPDAEKACIKVAMLEDSAGTVSPLQESSTYDLIGDISLAEGHYETAERAFAQSVTIKRSLDFCVDGELVRTLWSFAQVESRLGKQGEADAARCEIDEIQVRCARRR